MFPRKEEIIDRVKEQIIRNIAWGEENLKVPLLILHVRYTFSKRNSSSFVTSGFLEHQMFFALNYISQIETVAKFEEVHKRTNTSPGIASFEGDWKSHVDALVAHEMAHVFEAMSKYEPVTGSIIREYYQYQPKSRKTKHHNLLWRKIYCDLKTSPKPKGCNTIVIEGEGAFDCYFKSGDDV